MEALELSDYAGSLGKVLQYLPTKSPPSNAGNR